MRSNVPLRLGVALLIGLGGMASAEDKIPPGVVGGGVPQVVQPSQSRMRAEGMLPPASILAPDSSAGLAPGQVDGTCVSDAADTTSWGLIGGASLYLLKPYFEGNTAYVTSTGTNTNEPRRVETAFSWDYSASPAFWLGIVGPDGLGLRARYFHFEQASSDLTTVLTPGETATGASIFPPLDLSLLQPVARPFGAPGNNLGFFGLGQDQLEFGSSLKIHSLDVEALKEWDFGQFQLEISGGGCYLELSQDYTATLANQATRGAATATESQDLLFNQRFQGGGPTLAAEGRWQIGGSGFSLFANARGTLLVGTTHESLSLSQVVQDPAGIVGGSQSITASSDARRDHVLPVAEIELGVEYARQVRGIEPFFRAGVVDLTYFNAGNASSQDRNLSLFGATLSLGVKY